MQGSVQFIDFGELNFSWKYYRHQHLVDSPAAAGLHFKAELGKSVDWEMISQYVCC